MTDRLSEQVSHPPDSGTPWTRGNLRMSQTLLDEVYAHAKESYPSECCGFLFGPTVEPALLTDLQREENEADKYHRLDPETFPRTSREYFKINELRATRTFERKQQAGLPVKVIYHSHCDSGAHFSREDADTFSQDGNLMWPCAYLVVSVVDGDVKDHKLWIHRTGSDDFDASPLTIDAA